MGFSFEGDFGGKNALAGGRFNSTPALSIYTDFPEMMTPIARLPVARVFPLHARKLGTVAAADGAF
jgi:hypothetical protein